VQKENPVFFDFECFPVLGKFEKCKRRLQYSSTSSVFLCWDCFRAAKGESSILTLQVFCFVGISLRTARENPVFLDFEWSALLGLLQNSKRRIQFCSVKSLGNLGIV
jgi:hypothetical protein